VDHIITAIFSACKESFLGGGGVGANIGTWAESKRPITATSAIRSCARSYISQEATISITIT